LDEASRPLLLDPFGRKGLGRHRVGQVRKRHGVANVRLRGQSTLSRYLLGGYVEESLVGLVRANRVVDRLFDPVLLKGLRVPLAYGFPDLAMNAGRLLLIYSNQSLVAALVAQEDLANFDGRRRREICRISRATFSSAQVPPP
jgi:hypothetical protein